MPVNAELHALLVGWVALASFGDTGREIVGVRTVAGYLLSAELRASRMASGEETKHLGMIAEEEAQ